MKSGVSSPPREGNTQQMDEHGFRQAFREHKDSVYAFAYRMTSSAAIAEDVTQDCFLELFRRPERFSPARGSLRNYLFGIARNLALKRCRRENRYHPLDDDAALRRSEDGPLDAAVAVARAIQALPALQREAVILVEYEGLTLEETAAVTQTNVGAVKSRLHRGREKLRQKLAPLRPVSRGC
jgi:RNA polymerase sigma-70 factor (ECF subfamily)